MQNYSQNNEQEIIINYFSGRTGVCLDIGANDGVTYSNTFAMCRDLGWKGIFLEPSAKAFARLVENTKQIPAGNAILRNYGIAGTSGLASFQDSGAFLNENNTALLSTRHASEMARWGGKTQYTEVQAMFLSWPDFVDELRKMGIYKVDFVTIDAEGEDYAILQQMERLPVAMDCICIEHNGKSDIIAGYIEVCKRMGLPREIGRNAENLIFAK